MVGRAEDLLRRLGLAYRVLLMATRDMGFVQAKKYDLEVWAPGVERWLEVSSCSNFRDYQARRMAIRYRPAPGARPELVHTLNGSGLALAAGGRRDPGDVPAGGRAVSASRSRSGPRSGRTCCAHQPDRCRAGRGAETAAAGPAALRLARLYRSGAGPSPIPVHDRPVYDLRLMYPRAGPDPRQPPSDRMELQRAPGSANPSVNGAIST